MAIRWTKARLEEHQLKGIARPKRNKYNAEPVYVDGWRLDSKREARRFQELLMLQRTGKVIRFLRQVPLHLAPAGTHQKRASIMRLDFVVWWANGSITWEDSKGVKTEAWKVRAAMAEKLYNIEIKAL